MAEARIFQRSVRLMANVQSLSVYDPRRHERRIKLVALYVLSLHSLNISDGTVGKFVGGDGGRRSMIGPEMYLPTLKVGNGLGLPE